MVKRGMSLETFLEHRSSSRGDYEIKFSSLDKQGKSFSRLGPKYGIACLRVSENSQSIALKRKYMIAYFKSFRRETTILSYLPY